MKRNLYKTSLNNNKYPKSPTTIDS